MEQKKKVEIEPCDAKGYIQTCRNRMGVTVNMMCASCLHKKLTRQVKSRYCKKHKREVSPHDVCSLWQMSESLNMKR